MVDNIRGVRQFVVGTGGAVLRSFSTVRIGSQVRSMASKGVLRLTLQETGYAWTFLSVAGSSFTDQGSGTCVPAAEGSREHRPHGFCRT